MFQNLPINTLVVTVLFPKHGVVLITLNTHFSISLLTEIKPKITKPHRGTNINVV